MKQPVLPQVPSSHSRWASAGAGLITLLLFLPGIFFEHNVHVTSDVTQSQGERKRNYFLCRPLPPFPPTLRKRDAAYNYLKYWITVKGCSSLPGAAHYLGPGGWAKKVYLDTSFKLFHYRLRKLLTLCPV